MNRKAWRRKPLSHLQGSKRSNVVGYNRRGACCYLGLGKLLLNSNSRLRSTTKTYGQYALSHSTRLHCFIRRYELSSKPVTGGLRKPFWIPRRHPGVVTRMGSLPSLLNIRTLTMTFASGVLDLIRSDPFRLRGIKGCSKGITCVLGCTVDD